MISQRMCFRIISYILIQAFIALDFCWAGTFSTSAEQSTLAPAMAINKLELEFIFDEIFENDLDDVDIDINDVDMDSQIKIGKMDRNLKSSPANSSNSSSLDIANGRNIPEESILPPPPKNSPTPYIAAQMSLPLNKNTTANADDEEKNKELKDSSGKAGFMQVGEYNGLNIVDLRPQTRQGQINPAELGLPAQKTAKLFRRISILARYYSDETFWPGFKKLSIGISDSKNAVMQVDENDNTHLAIIQHAIPDLIRLMEESPNLFRELIEALLVHEGGKHGHVMLLELEPEDIIWNNFEEVMNRIYDFTTERKYPKHVYNRKNRPPFELWKTALDILWTSLVNNGFNPLRADPWNIKWIESQANLGMVHEKGARSVALWFWYSREFSKPVGEIADIEEELAENFAFLEKQKITKREVFEEIKKVKQEYEAEKNSVKSMLGSILTGIGAGLLALFIPAISYSADITIMFPGKSFEATFSIVGLAVIVWMIFKYYKTRDLTQSEILRKFRRATKSQKKQEEFRKFYNNLASPEKILVLDTLWQMLISEKNQRQKVNPDYIEQYFLDALQDKDENVRFVAARLITNFIGANYSSARFMVNLEQYIANNIENSVVAAITRSLEKDYNLYFSKPEGTFKIRKKIIDTNEELNESKKKISGKFSATPIATGIVMGLLTYFGFNPDLFAGSGIYHAANVFSVNWFPVILPGLIIMAVLSKIFNQGDLILKRFRKAVDIGKKTNLIEFKNYFEQGKQEEQIAIIKILLDAALRGKDRIIGPESIQYILLAGLELQNEAKVRVYTARAIRKFAEAGYGTSSFISDLEKYAVNDENIWIRTIINEALEKNYGLHYSSTDRKFRAKSYKEFIKEKIENEKYFASYDFENTTMKDKPRIKFLLKQMLSFKNRTVEKDTRRFINTAIRKGETKKLLNFYRSSSVFDKIRIINISVKYILANRYRVNAEFFKWFFLDALYETPAKEILKLEKIVEETTKPVGIRQRSVPVLKMMNSVIIYALDTYNKQAAIDTYNKKVANKLDINAVLLELSQLVVDLAAAGFLHSEGDFMQGIANNEILSSHIKTDNTEARNLYQIIIDELVKSPYFPEDYIVVSIKKELRKLRGHIDAQRAAIELAPFLIENLAFLDREIKKPDFMDKMYRSSVAFNGSLISADQKEQFFANISGVLINNIALRIAFRDSLSNLDQAIEQLNIGINSQKEAEELFPVMLRSGLSRDEDEVLKKKEENVVYRRFYNKLEKKVDELHMASIAALETFSEEKLGGSRLISALEGIIKEYLRTEGSKLNPTVKIKINTVIENLTKGKKSGLLKQTAPDIKINKLGFQKSFFNLSLINSSV